jgi:hypothetical protein
VADELAADLRFYAAATQRLREAAKWLLAAAAGVGGVLVAGLQLGDLNQLSLQEWPRIIVALSGVVVALAGVGMVLTRATAVLTHDWVTSKGAR